MRAGAFFVRLLPALFAGAALAGDAVRLAADPWPPYNLAPDGQRLGSMVDVAVLAFAEAGLEVDYFVVGWTRAVAGTRDGLFDGAVGASLVDGAGLVFPETTLAAVVQGLATRRASDWSWRGPASLEGLVLGGVQDYDYGPQLNAYVAEWGGDPRRVQLLHGSDALEANLRKLVAGRVDVVVDAAATLEWTIASLDFDSLLCVNARLERVTPCTIAFTPSERGRRLARLLDEGVAVLAADGRLDSLLGAYGLAGSVEPALPARRSD